MQVLAALGILTAYFVTGAAILGLAERFLGELDEDDFIKGVIMILWPLFLALMVPIGIVYLMLVVYGAAKGR